MSTDIVDKDLKALRNARWETAFSSDAAAQGGVVDKARIPNKASTDRKATIVIEHLIQASDISHTMQHWHVYRKWNQCLFEEMYLAFLNGRANKNPAEFWYKGEIGFFDVSTPTRRDETETPASITLPLLTHRSILASCF